MTRFFLFLDGVFAKLKRFFYRVFLWHSKNNWHISKKRNFYNPTLGATVYKWGLSWNMVRHDIHYEGYKSKSCAMQAAFLMWLKENLRSKRVNTPPSLI